MLKQMKTAVTVSAVVSACPNGVRLRGTGVFGGQLVGGLLGSQRQADECLTGAVRGGESLGYEGSVEDRPFQASAAVAGAGFGRRAAVVSEKRSTTQHDQQIHHHSKWAFRGPDPWRCHT